MANDDTRELRRKLRLPQTPARDIPGLVDALEKLEKLDRRESSGLAERVGTLEKSLEAFAEKFVSLAKRVDIIERPRKGPVGFGG